MYYKPKPDKSVPWDSRWKQIADFPSYWVSNHNQVFNMRRGEVLSTFVNQKGILCVRLYHQRFGGSHGTTRAVDKLRRIAFEEREQAF